MSNSSTVHTTSTGHTLSEATYLDSHYLACQPEYEAMLQSVGLQMGWHVLDAGCGGGSFLPLMSQLVGSSGQIQALDLAPENVALVESWQKQNAYACPVTVQVGTVTKLHYEDDTFDAVWCANIMQYLNDEELVRTLSEFQRVLKSGGLLGLKDSSAICSQWQPSDPLLWARTLQALIDSGHQYARQLSRGATLPIWVKRAGFKMIRANTVMIERQRPLRDSEEAYLTAVLNRIAQVAQANDAVSNADQASWMRLGSSSSPDFILNHPDFYYSEGHMMILAENS